MNKPQKSEQPGSDDAVLGGQVSPPTESVVIGGLEGVKQKYNSNSIDLRIAALREALKYKNGGLNFVIQALRDTDGKVQLSALRLLHERKETHVIQAIEEYLNFLSQEGIDYKLLKNLLFAQKWELADKQTRIIVLQVARREKKWLYRYDISSLPCEKLGIIDHLWRKYSGDRFGFTVQSQILAASKSGEDFVKQVGWQKVDASDDWVRKFDLRRQKDISFDLSAPPGHLPRTFSLGGGKKELKPYTTDTESVMGFYSIDGYKYKWQYSSFFGIEMVQSFLEKFNKCQENRA